MKLTILGSSPSIPNPGGASSGYLIQEQETSILVDCGHGVSSVLQQVLEPGSLQAIVLSHMHPDHFFDLVPLTYAFLFDNLPPIPLCLPAGGRQILNRLQDAVGLSDGFFPAAFELVEYDPNRSLQVGQLEITFAPVRHFVEGYAMRFGSWSSPGRDLAYTSDTAWSERVLELARDAALALVESTLADNPTPHELEGHLTPSQAGRLGREAGVRRLVLTHYFRRAAPTIHSKASAAFGGHVDLAEERQTYEI